MLEETHVDPALHPPAGWNCLLIDALELECACSLTTHSLSFCCTEGSYGWEQLGPCSTSWLWQVSETLILCDWLVECSKHQDCHINRMTVFKAAATTHTGHQLWGVSDWKLHHTAGELIICISLRFFTNMITNFTCILNVLLDYKVKSSPDVCGQW